MSTWQDRVKTEIDLKSPTGKEFTAKWVGNSRSGEHKLGLFDYPKIAGTAAQDLNIKSIQYPLNIYFDDENHDKTADTFFKSCGEVGRWEIQHPVYGGLQLQLISYTQEIEPINAGGSTPFKLSFFEPGDADIIVSKQELFGNVLAAIDAANAATIGKFADKVSEISGKARAGMSAAVNVATSAVDAVLGPIAQINNEINATFLAIQRGIDETLTATILDPIALGGQIVNLVQTPGLIVASTEEKINSYKNLAAALFEIESEEPAVLEAKELYISAANSALSSIAADTDAELSTTVLTQMEDVIDYFDNIVNNLEADQNQFLDSTMDKQYVSMVGTFSEQFIVSANTLRSLIKSSLELSIEKRLILETYKAPIAICIEEYNTDEKLDFFIETNNLTGDEILLLPPGKEVLIYQAFV